MITQFFFFFNLYSGQVKKSDAVPAPTESGSAGQVDNGSTTQHKCSKTICYCYSSGIPTGMPPTPGCRRSSPPT